MNNIHIILKVCDKIDSVNGLKRPFGLDKSKTIKTCFSSLMNGLYGKIPFAMTILADDISDDTKNFISSVCPKDIDLIDITEVTKQNNGKIPNAPKVCHIPDAGNSVFGVNYVRLLLSKPGLGSEGSMIKSFDAADSVIENNDTNDTWIFFLEDDYLFNYHLFAQRLSDFWQYQESMKFALPIFIHPSDYPDQYTRLLSRCYLFQTLTGYWREVCSTTYSFMCQAPTYKKFSSFFRECVFDGQDGKLSTIFKKSALCFSPMPGFATHMHEGVMSNYVPWEEIVKSLNKPNA